MQTKHINIGCMCVILCIMFGIQVILHDILCYWCSAWNTQWNWDRTEWYAVKRFHFFPALFTAILFNVLIDLQWGMLAPIPNIWGWYGLRKHIWIGGSAFGRERAKEWEKKKTVQNIKSMDLDGKCVAPFLFSEQIWKPQENSGKRANSPKRKHHIFFMNRKMVCLECMCMGFFVSQR